MVTTQGPAVIDMVEATWARWAEVGMTLGEDDWSAPSRCPGWSVRALYAHVAMVPAVYAGLPARQGVGPATHTCAAELLSMFNAGGGSAHAMADTIRDTTAEAAAAATTEQLLAGFGPAAVGAALAAGRGHPDTVVDYFGVARVTMATAAEMALVESVVHLLDVLRALGRAPDVPADATRAVAMTLAAMADPVALVEAATGRAGAGTPFPVLR